MPTQLSSTTVLGVRVDQVAWPEIEQFCRQTLEQNGPKQIVTVNGEFVLEAQHNAEFKAVINGADLVIPDSTNVKWFGNLKGGHIPTVTPGSDLVIRLCTIAAQLKQSVFLLGGRPDVARMAGSKLQSLITDLEIAGSSSADPNDERVLQMIRQSGASIVLVGYGAPKQELWIAQNKEKASAKLYVGVGGTFDMLSGSLPRAPHLLRGLHLEWLWRVILQPKRIKRIWNAVVVFPIMALFS